MKYSVVIPVYNAEKTLRRCVDSLLCQDCSDAEIILVNDGSKDGSLELCREYEGAHSFIRVVDKENGGVSSARNAGLDLAEGTYVLFVDSDDSVPETLFDTLNAYTEEDVWDLVRLSTCIDNGKEIHNRIMQRESFTSRAEAFPKIIDDICRKRLNQPVAKLYRRAILEDNGIRFPLGVSVAEDRALNIRFSMFIERYAISDQIGYIINTENEQSLTRSLKRDLEDQFRIADAYTETAIREADLPEYEKEQYRQAINFGKCRSIYREAKDQRREGRGWLERQKYLWKRCGEINRQKMRYPKSRYCRRITLPVRLRGTILIDFAAKRLLK